MKIVISHPTGNANVRALVNGLKQESMLEKFITCIAYFDKSPLLRVNLKDAERRRFDEILQEDTITHPWKETARLLAIKLGLNFFTSPASAILSIDNVGRNLDIFLSGFLKQPVTVNAVYSYEDVSYNAFKTARQKGIKTIYDLPIAYWETAKKLLWEEAERLPRWKHTINYGLKDSAKKLERKTKELELADIVIVPSTFVYNSLPSWALNKRIVVAPFGTPHTTKEMPLKKQNSAKRLRVLFAGSMSQRKGLADLFEAVKLLNTASVELVVLGSLMTSLQFYKKELPGFIYEPTRPHNEVLNLMESCDVFCLPSIVEGRALVIQEAMSRQLPVIITSNTGGGDMIIDGNTGFLVPIRSPYAIAEKINWFLENRHQLPEMGKFAKEQAEKYTWQGYANKIIAGIKSFCENN